MSEPDYQPKPWHSTYARSIATISLVLPILGAFLYHADRFSHIGQASFGISLGRGLIMTGLALMMLMPKAFRRILDSKGILDEYEIYQRARTFYMAYKLIIVTALVLIAIAAYAGHEGLGGKAMQSMLISIFMILLAYSMIIPFNILAWTMTPLDTE